MSNKINDGDIQSRVMWSGVMKVKERKLGKGQLILIPFCVMCMYFFLHVHHHRHSSFWAIFTETELSTVYIVSVTVDSNF